MIGDTTKMLTLDHGRLGDRFGLGPLVIDAAFISAR